jgi:hypothetical protein
LRTQCLGRRDFHRGVVPARCPHTLADVEGIYAAALGHLDVPHKQVAAEAVPPGRFGFRVKGRWAVSLVSGV